MLESLYSMKLLKKILSIGKIFSRSRKKAPDGRAAKPSGSRRKLSDSGCGGPQNGGRPNSRRTQRRGGGSRGESRGRGRGGSSARKSADSRETPEMPAPLPKEVPAPFGMEELVGAVPEFAKFELGAEVLSAVKDMGYSSPTPIQSAAIPVILEGSDVIGTAQTGTGKTAAFALPVVKLAGSHEPSGPRILVLSPTRELAAQSADAFESFSKYTSLRSLLVQGGVNMDRQTAALRSGVDAVIATPGRLLDHIRPAQHFAQRRALAGSRRG